jgi:6-phosphogluconolactonase (cycloisomerase 2 family)
MRRRPWILALCLCVLAPLAASSAISRPGALVELAGAGGCVSQATTLGCTAARGLDDARAVALSPDGATLYAVAATPASVTSFGVDAQTGLLAQLNLSAGCLVSIAQTGCGTVRALTGASAVAVSPDGLHVYVAAATTGSVATFTRQPNGSLVQNAGIAGCTTAVATAGCDLASGIGGADAIAISPDGRFVYVAGSADNAIVIFTRDAATGRLQPLAGAAGCLRAPPSGCTPVTGLVGPSALALTPDGTSLYATSAGGTLTAFRRDPVSGALAQQTPGCLSEAAQTGCTAIGGLAGASAVAVSHDGATVLVTAADDDAVSSFRRDPATGALVRASCFAGSLATPACPVWTLLLGPRAAIFRPDGLVAWVAASRGNSLVTFQVDPLTSIITPTTGPAGCVRTTASADCRAARALDDVRGLATSTDGGVVFAASAASDGIAVLGRQREPSCLNVRANAVANRARSVVVACSDPNGDKVALTILSKPAHGTIGIANATGSVLYRPSPGYTGLDSFTYTASDGLDASGIGTATISVALPPKAPVVRIRTGRTHLLAQKRIRVLVECPLAAIGPCRFAARLVVNGRSTYALARTARGKTATIVIRAGGAKGRTKAQFSVTVRDQTRLATVSGRTILVLP